MFLKNNLQNNSKEILSDAFAYLDDITVCATNQKEHDENLSKFFAAIEKYGITVNEKKIINILTALNIIAGGVEWEWF